MSKIATTTTSIMSRPELKYQGDKIYISNVVYFKAADVEELRSSIAKCVKTVSDNIRELDEEIDFKYKGMVAIPQPQGMKVVAILNVPDAKAASAFIKSYKANTTINNRIAQELIRVARLLCAGNFDHVLQITGDVSNSVKIAIHDLFNEAVNHALTKSNLKLITGFPDELAKSNNAEMVVYDIIGLIEKQFDKKYKGGWGDAPDSDLIKFINQINVDDIYTARMLSVIQDFYLEKHPQAIETPMVLKFKSEHYSRPYGSVDGPQGGDYSMYLDLEPAEAAAELKRVVPRNGPVIVQNNGSVSVHGYGSTKNKGKADVLKALKEFSHKTNVKVEGI